MNFFLSAKNSAFLDSSLYPPEFAHLACLPGPLWATRSDYNACVPLQLSEEGEEVSEDFYDDEGKNVS